MPPKTSRLAPRNPTRRTREERQELERVESERRLVRAEASAASATAEAANRRPLYGHTATAGERWRASTSQGHGLGGSLKYVRGGRGRFMGRSRAEEKESKNTTKQTKSTDAGATSGARSSGSTGRGGAGSRRRRGRNAGAEADTATVVKSDPEADPQTGPSDMMRQLSMRGNDSSSDESGEAYHGVNVDQFIDRRRDEEQDGDDSDVQFVGERAIPPKQTLGSMVPTKPHHVSHVNRTRSLDDEIISSHIIHRRDGKGKARQEGDEATVKQEPDASGAAEIIPLPDISSSEEEEEAVRATDSSDEAGLSPSTVRNRAQRRASRASAKRSLPLTKQDEREYERHQQDLEDIRDELGYDHDGASRVKAANPPSTRRSAATAAEPEEPPDQKAGAVYLFQLPPILPDLHDSSTLPQKASSPESTKKGYVQPSRSATTGFDPSNPIKVEDNEPAVDGVSTTRHQSLQKPHLSPGLAGQLVVHKSGRTTLSWGGTSMEVNLGINPFFLQTVVLADVPDEQATLDSDNGDVAMRNTNHHTHKPEAVSFGQIRGKFVVTPDLNEILG